MINYKYLLSILVFFGLSLSLIKAEDTVKVQALTFKDISKRRTLVEFPNNSDEYRKILMLYRLKCDPLTPWDQYNCGEWDYLAYTHLYKHTGIMDSTLKTIPQYKIRGASPDIIKLAKVPGKTTYKKKEYTQTITQIDNEKLLNLNGNNGLNINFDKKQGFRIQFILSKDTLVKNGITKSDLSYIKLYASKAGTVKNFSIRLKKESVAKSTNMIAQGLETVYTKKSQTFVEGENIIVLDKAFPWTRFFHLLVEVSGEQPSTGDLPELNGYKGDGYLISQGVNRYLLCSGQNDFVNGNDLPEFGGINQLTMEGWFKVDKWNNWAWLFKFGDNTGIQLGDNVGQLYAILRDSVNQHGNATNLIKVGEWFHAALVFLGSGADAKSRLKLYVNGEPILMSYTATIPKITDKKAISLMLGSPALVGAIDEIRIFNRAMTEITIKENMYKFDDISATHPEHSSLIAYYKFDEVDGTNVINSSKVKVDATPAKLIGCPARKISNPSDLVADTKNNVTNLKSVFGFGNAKTTIDSTEYEEYEFAPKVSLHKYKLENRKAIESEVTYHYPVGYFYTYNSDGKKIDSNLVAPDTTIANTKLQYYDPPFEVLNKWEIARYITPYGKGLDLGPDGFLWIYDVTDYASMLKGTVDIEAHNTQELIDLKFYMIKGTPPRDVISIKNVWAPMSVYSYANMSNNKVMYDTLHKLNPETKQVKIITRLTGHGHQSNDGTYPHCCEWKDNTHSLFAYGKNIANWHIWREDCSENPVFPQGGTWPGSREGWCPGDIVRDFEFELTDYIKNGEVSIDYAITPVPKDNPGMGNGDYVVAAQLIEYDKANFDNDMEIYEIISPNSWDYYQRKYPLCQSPKIVIRNNGSADITSFKIEYYVSGGLKLEYFAPKNYSLKPNLKDTISLPVVNNKFWVGDANLKFTANILEVNGTKDLNNVNDSYTTKFEMPDLYKDAIYIELKTNVRGSHFNYELKDLTGKTIFSRSQLKSNFTYRDTLYNMPEGCYNLVLTDLYNYGLKYWAYPDQGEGWFKIFKTNGTLLKNFNPDCGRGYDYSMHLGAISFVKESGFDDYFELYPMPCHSSVNLKSKSLNGLLDIEIYDIEGQIIDKFTKTAIEGNVININTENIPAGFYNMIITNGSTKYQQKLIKK